MTVLVKPQTVRVTVSTNTGGVTIGGQVVKEYVEVETYDGEYTVTPSQETQVLATTNKRLVQNVTVNPIPSNYGRIDWNGQYLTVS